MTDNMTTIPIISPDAADERPVAIYVHGLASGAAGTTFNTLAKEFTQYRWITTDFGETIDGNVAILESMVRMHRPSLVVGTSMGGVTMLYANTPPRYRKDSVQSCAVYC
jgi:predicted alpha/beta-fold hydrolase